VVAVALAVSHDYRERIFPGVTIVDPTGTIGPIAVGDLSRQAARARVRSSLGSLEERGLAVQVGEDRRWTLSWARAGQSFAVDDAVAQAFAVVRDQPWALGFVRVLHPDPVTISLSIVPAEPALVLAFAEESLPDPTTLPSPSSAGVRRQRRLKRDGNSTRRGRPQRSSVPSRPALAASNSYPIRLHLRLPARNRH
jgi:hypothetical protein